MFFSEVYWRSDWFSRKIKVIEKQKSFWELLLIFILDLLKDGLSYIFFTPAQITAQV